MEWFTNAPVLEVRDIAGMLGAGWYKAGIGEPAWAETVIVARGSVLHRMRLALMQRGYRMEPEGRGIVFSDQTFVQAAQNVSAR